ncbi:hypothetical protein J5751_05185 [bacterium]|nr:hypothetical protein [bacterium]
MELIEQEVPVFEKRTRYKAKDGRVFDTQRECEMHELITDGKARICPDCNGRGEREHCNEVLDPGWHPGRGEARYLTEKKWGPCSTCHGKGYLVKKVKVIWE